MTDDVVEALIAGNDRYARRTAGSRGADGAPTTGLLVTCPGGDQPTVSPWPLGGPRRTATVTSLGSRVRERQDGSPVVRPDLASAGRDADAVVVVGHTDCDLLADAYDRHLGPSVAAADGPRAATAGPGPLDPTVDAALEADLIDHATPRGTAVPRLRSTTSAARCTHSGRCSGRPRSLATSTTRPARTGRSPAGGIWSRSTERWTHRLSANGFPTNASTSAPFSTDFHLLNTGTFLDYTIENVLVI